MSDRTLDYVDLDEVQGALQNPKGHAEADLASSLERFGFTEAPLLDERTGRLVVGHGRLDALRARRDRGEAPPEGVTAADGRWLVPVQRGWSSRDDAEASAYLLASNQLTTAGGWSDDLGPMLDDLAAQGVPLDGLGWSADDLDALMPSRSPAQHGEPFDDAPVGPPGDPVTKPGDVWEIGPHRLLCGDCRNPDDMARLLDGVRVNLAVTSPPYADRRKYDETTDFVPVHPDEYIEWFAPVAANIAAHLMPDGSWLVNIRAGADEGQRALYVFDLVTAHVRQWGWMFVDDLCWVKTNGGVPGRWPNRHKNAWEPVFHFARQSEIVFHPERNATPSDDVFAYSADNPKARSDSGLLGSMDKKDYGSGMALPSNVLKIRAESQQGDHPAPYPVGLPAALVRCYSDPDANVFDPFCGSGSTLIAAAIEIRSGLGMEVSPAYCDVTLTRLQRHTGHKPTRDGEPHDFTAGD